jgi:hypothetical protein
VGARRQGNGECASGFQADDIELRPDSQAWMSSTGMPGRLHEIGQAVSVHRDRAARTFARP